MLPGIIVSNEERVTSYLKNLVKYILQPSSTDCCCAFLTRHSGHGVMGKVDFIASTLHLLSRAEIIVLILSSSFDISVSNVSSLEESHIKIYPLQSPALRESNVVRQVDVINSHPGRVVI